MALALLFMAAIQAAAAPPAPAMLRCALVTPHGDNVSFSLAGWGDQEEFVDLVAEQGTVWPARTLPGARNIMQGPGNAGRMFAFGAGNGIALQVSDSGGNVRAATLYRRDRQRAALPLAYGYCAPAAATAYAPVDDHASAAEIGADIPALDPGRWGNEACSLLLSDGRRLPLRFEETGQGANVSMSSPSLWAGRTVTAPFAWVEAPSGRLVGMFDRRGGPSGGQDIVLDEPAHRGAKLIQLRDLGDPAAVNQRGFAICFALNMTGPPNPNAPVSRADAERSRPLR